MYVTYIPGVGTRTDVETTGMTPGPHGLHIHEFGDLSNGVTGASTGGHYNPLGAIHGCYPTPSGEVPAEARAVGDRGNVLVGADGVGFYSESTNELVFLDGALSIIGRAAILHALEDNCVREQGPGGELSAGARIGFCVIGYAEEEDVETQRHRQRIREGYAKLSSQFNRTGGA